MGVALKKIDGVKSVEVSLNQGLARVYMKSDNKVSLEELRKAIETRGFTPKEAKVKVKGKVVQADGGHHLEVTGTRDKFKIKCAEKGDTHEISIETGEATLIEGLIPLCGHPFSFQLSSATRTGSWKVLPPSRLVDTTTSRISTGKTLRHTI